MSNMFTLIARLVSISDAPEYGDDAKLVILKTPRAYKNAEGIYEEDLFDVILKGNIGEKTIEYCATGDVIGIKGSLESFKYEQNGKKYRRTMVNVQDVGSVVLHYSPSLLLNIILLRII